MPDIKIIYRGAKPAGATTGADVEKTTKLTREEWNQNDFNLKDILVKMLAGTPGYEAGNAAKLGGVAASGYMPIAGSAGQAVTFGAVSATTGTFSGLVKIGRPADYWSSTTEYYSVQGSGALTHHGSDSVSLVSNGYRNNAGTWTSLAKNGYTGAAIVSVDPQGRIRFGVEAVKATGSGFEITQRAEFAPTGELLINKTTVTAGGGLLQVNGGISATTIKTGGYTVATLPAGTTGERAYVTDATAPTFGGTLTGGGSLVIPVIKNATAWIAA